MTREAELRKGCGKAVFHKFCNGNTLCLECQAELKGTTEDIAKYFGELTNHSQQHLRTGCNNARVKSNDGEDALKRSAITNGEKAE